MTLIYDIEQYSLIFVYIFEYAFYAKIDSIEKRPKKPYKTFETTWNQ